MTEKRKVDWDDGECVAAYFRNPGDFETEDWFGKGDYTEERREKLKGVTLDDAMRDIQELHSKEFQTVS
jgi:hypothetical protein